MWSLLVLAMAIVLVLLTSRILLIRRNSGKPKRDKTKDYVSVLAVIGSGGHTREMMCLIKTLGQHYKPRHFVIAETDKMSEHKIKECEGADSQIIIIPRSREVKQSYITSIISTVWAVLFTLPVVLRLCPDVILANGPGTCIPVCIWGLLLKILGLHDTKVVYVESFCRVNSLSLSGKLLYPFISDFFVQWPQLQLKYPNAKFIGRLI